MVYFTLSKYKEDYDINMSNYIINNEDFDEIDFIRSEIENYNINLKLLSSNPVLAFSEFTNPLTNDYKDDISLKNSIEDDYLIIGSNIFREHKEQYCEIRNEVLKDSTSSKISSLKKIFLKIIEFLKMKKNENEMTEHKNNNISLETLKWIGTQTDFIELIKALIENGNIKGTQTEIISKLSNVFNIEIKHPNKLINDIKGRNNGSETLFLDKLQKSLFDYITLEKKK